MLIKEPILICLFLCTALENFA